MNNAGRLSRNQRDFTIILKEQLYRHPLMAVQDVVKLIYQSIYGPGHMIDDEEESLRRLETEYRLAEPSDVLPVFEPIGGNLARLNLAAVKKSFPHLAPATINRLFKITANQKRGSRAEMRKQLDVFRQFFKAEHPAFSTGETERYLTKYAKQGFPALSHSDAYRADYAPHYRVIDRGFLRFLLLFEAIDRRLLEKSYLNIAIDGDCGSGKSTLGILLEDVYGANLIRADDFFLPKELRTPERLAAPGNNIHFERFLEELAPLLEHKPISYRVFDCSVMDYTETVDLPPASVTVVEGSYSCRPDFLFLYDIKVFLTVDPEEQLRRIEARGGKGTVKDFKERWIPLEHAYFDACGVRDAVDFLFDTTNPAI